MTNFKVVNTLGDLALRGAWTEAENFEGVGRIVDENGEDARVGYSGPLYKLIAKKEREFTTLERFGRTSLGTLAGISSLSLALFSKPVRDLFLEEKESVYFGILASASDHEREAIIRKVQCCARGYLARKSFLKSPFSEYDAQCEKVLKSPDSMPRAHGGKTKVYLPIEMPGVVLKKSGRNAARDRFHQMRAVRPLLGPHLTIPRARRCQEFLVEERLPINVGNFHNMGLYLSHTKLFDEAVRELTRLFSKASLLDLVGPQTHPLGYIDGVGDVVRYDNLPLYIVERDGKKEGKIGLIDLEGFVYFPNYQSDSNPQYYHGPAVLARIFPLHLDLIIEEANKLRMKIDTLSLRAAAEKGKKYLKVGFTDHLEWLKKRGLSSSPFEVSPQRVSELTMLTELELLKLNRGINDTSAKKGCQNEPPQNFLGPDPEKVAKELAKEIAPLIIRDIKEQIEQREKLAKPQKRDLTESEWVSLRSPYMKRPELCKGIYSLIKDKILSITEDFDVTETRNIVEKLLYVTCQELVRGGEIFFFDPAYYTGNDDFCWIRY